MGSGIRFEAGRLLALASLVVAPAAGAMEDDCPTFFPDFRCERSGRYPGFVMPVTMPYLFEDPFITTSLNGVFIWNDFPTGQHSAMEGGEAYIAALQVRVAVTDRLAFIATKDGYAWHRPDNPLLKNERGFYDIGAGFKYALVDRPEDDFILAPSLRIEVPTGNEDVWQGHGDGVLIPGVSAAWGLGDFHAIADLGAQIPFDMGDQSQSFYYNLHLDYAVHEHFVPFVSFNGMHWTDSGNGKLRIELRGGARPTLSTVQAVLGTGSFEGFDALNLGSKSVQGNDVATFAVGARFPITKHLSLGAAYEFPMTTREDIINQRVTTVITFEL